jgi:copper(I)-binding protein
LPYSGTAQHIKNSENEMSRLLRAAFAVAFTLVTLTIAGCSPSGDKPSGQISVADAWTMATPPGADVGAGYMTISNGTASPVRLTGGETPASATVEVHMMSMDNGVMRMRPASEGIEIPAGEQVTLEPGGYHLMLIGLNAPLAEGSSVPLTLVFDGGLRVETALAVRAMGGGHGH